MQHKPQKWKEVAAQTTELGASPEYRPQFCLNMYALNVKQKNYR